MQKQKPFTPYILKQNGYFTWFGKEISSAGIVDGGDQVYYSRKVFERKTGSYGVGFTIEIYGYQRRETKLVQSFAVDDTRTDRKTRWYSYERKN